MKKILVKTAAILAASELAVMVFSSYTGLDKNRIWVLLDPLAMVAVSLLPLYLLLRGERAKLDKRDLLDSKLNQIVDGLWNASIHTLSSDVLLQKILLEIIEKSPVSVIHKGAIFLVEDGALRLKASVGFPDELKRACAVIPPGKCLCGRMLQAGEMIFASTLDDRHDIKMPETPAHGHYCLPIKSGGTVIGALNLYLEPGHSRDEAEERFLSSVCAIIARIVEGKKLERSLFQMQKMEALNRFAAGIAHDFNNILGAIRGLCDVARLHLPKTCAGEEDICDICAALDRGEALTRQLKLFSRQMADSQETFDLNGELRRTEELVTRLIGAGIRTEFLLATGELPVRGNRSQLEQVLMNLAANARDAMPAGGEFRVETVAQDVCFTTSKRCFSAVKLSVSDTGSGMTEETVEKVFEPFFTTKPEGKGSGLGLSITHGIVRQFGGEIFVRSSPGAGTRFEIYLPLASAHPNNTPDPAN
jgi:signal transduction histidine kinase